MSKIKIVAEIGSNWDPDSPFESCRAMVDAVAEAGADYAKFQDWHPLEEFDRPDWWKEKCGKWTLSPQVLPLLRSNAQQRGLGFITSVFTQAAIERARHHDVVKIASSEIANHELLLEAVFRASHAAEFWVSLGEVKQGENLKVLASLMRFALRRVRLLACVAEYPVGRPLDLWDNFIFAQQFGLPLGVSSHIEYPQCRAMIKQLINRGADVVEVHVRMRGATPNDAPDNGPWALWMDELADLIGMIRRLDNA